MTMSKTKTKTRIRRKGPLYYPEYRACFIWWGMHAQYDGFNKSINYTANLDRAKAAIDNPFIYKPPMKKITKEIIKYP